MNYTTGKKLQRNLFFLLMCCFAAAILGDSTAEALFLARFGTEMVPRMFLVNAASLFILSAGMLSVVDRIDRRKVFLIVLLIHAGILLGVRVAVLAHLDFLFLPLFSYAYGTKILFFLLFWTVANDLIDSRSAGKAFPTIAAGGTIGAIGISFSISGLMRFFAVENLLFLWSGLIIITALLLIPLQKQYVAGTVERRIPAPTNSKTKMNFSFFALLRENPLLQNMSLLYALVFFLLLNQHFLFYQQIKNAFPSAESIASFLGSFNGVSMLLTCIIQVGVAGSIMRKLGSTRSMLLLPVALVIVFLAQIVITTVTGNAITWLFPAIIGGMGIRIAFFDAFFSPNFQLFFSSLPKEIRGRGKLVIEGVVKPLAMVFAGVFLWWVGPRLEIQVHCTILAIIAGAALFQAFRLKNAYTRTLTRYLTGMDGGKNTALLERFNFTGGEEFLSFFAHRLNKEEFEVQKYLVEIIASSGTDDAVSLLIDYLPKADVRLKATIIIALGNFPAPLVAEILQTYLVDSNSRVVANAVEALYACNAENLHELLTPLIKHPNRRVKVNVMHALWPISDPQQREMFVSQLTTMLYGGSAEDCASALYLTCQVVDETTTAMLYKFCNTKTAVSMIVERVYHQIVSALGKRPCRMSLELLLNISHQSTAQQRKKVIAALSTIIPHLEDVDWLDGFEKGNTIHKNCLLQAFRKTSMPLSASVITVLNRGATREIDAVEWEKKSLQVLAGSGSGRIALLSCAIREELISIRLDNLLHIAAVLDTSGVIASILPRLHHTDRHIRARAFEVFENTGDPKINRTVLHYLEWFARVPDLPADLNGPVQPKELVIAGTYSTSHNHWVAICAKYACGNI